MVNYPSRDDLKIFIEVLQKGDYKIKKYLPPISGDWYDHVYGCIEYLEHTAGYETNLSFAEIGAKLLYKVAKRHELGDGNKRSSVMALYLLCLLNDYYLYEPARVKRLAKRAASTKGRMNEAIMRKRLAAELENIIEKRKEPVA